MGLLKNVHRGEQRGCQKSEKSEAEEASEKKIPEETPSIVWGYGGWEEGKKREARVGMEREYQRKRKKKKFQESKIIKKSPDLARQELFSCSGKE